MKEYFDLSPFCKACCENYEVINSQEQKNNCVKQFARLFPISNKMLLSVKRIEDKMK